MDPIITLEDILVAYKAILTNEHARVGQFAALAQENLGRFEGFTFFTDGRAEAYVDAQVENKRAYLEANPDLVAFAQEAHAMQAMTAHEFAATVLDGQGIDAANAIAEANLNN